MGDLLENVPDTFNSLDLRFTEKKFGSVVIMKKIWRIILVFFIFFCCVLFLLFYTTPESIERMTIMSIAIGVAGTCTFEVLRWYAKGSDSPSLNYLGSVKYFLSKLCLRLHLLVAWNGVLFIYPERKQISEKRWDRFHFGAPLPKHLDIMGHTQTGLSSHLKRDKLLDIIRKGTHVRILILTDDDLCLQQVYEIGRSVDLSSWKSFQDKIRQTIDSFLDLKESISELDYKGTFEIRVTYHLLTYSINRRDDEMIVVPYVRNPEGDVAPAIHIKQTYRQKEFSLFSKYQKEFNELWIEAKPPRTRDPYRICISHHIERAEKISDFIKEHHNSELPEPVMITIYPTYLCSANCSYCMYKNYHIDEKGHKRHIDKALLESLLEGCVSEERKNKISIELSGGGEPLEYKHINVILQKMHSLHQERDAHYGLISNGLHITSDEFADLLVRTFDYIRLSLPECAEKDPHGNWHHKFNENLNRLIHLQVKNDSQCVIGLKFLLRNENKDTLLRTIEDYTNNYAVKHVKIKSVRSPDLTDNDICSFETAFYEKNFLQNDRVIHLDVQETKIYRNFRCWLNPLQAIITPDGTLYLCPNYFHQQDEATKRLKILSSGKDLWNFWGSQEHFQALRKLKESRNQHCGETGYCNCRIFEYQELYELFLMRTKAFRIIGSDEIVAPHFV